MDLGRNHHMPILIYLDYGTYFLCTEQSMNPTGVSKVTKSTPFMERRETVLFTVSIVSMCVYVCVCVCVCV